METELDCVDYMFVVYIIVGKCCNYSSQPWLVVC